MNLTAGKAIAIFLLLMLFFTFASHHLDALRNPRVLCVTPAPGAISGERYSAVVPAETVYLDKEPYVYVAEDTLSYFYPVTIRRASVRVLATGDGLTAVDGLYREARVVRYADRALTGGTIPVRVWEEDGP